MNTSYTLDQTGKNATLTFSGSYATGAANRLFDGNYDLSIDGSKITVAGTNRTWDADGNGSAAEIHVFGDTAGNLVSIEPLTLTATAKSTFSTTSDSRRTLPKPCRLVR